MAIKSYLAFTEPDQSDVFESEISKVDGCELIGAKGKEVFILITESKDEQNEKQIIGEIEGISSIKCLSLVGVWNNPI